MFIYAVYASVLDVRQGYSISIIQAVPGFYSTSGWEDWVSSPTLNTPLHSEIEFADDVLCRQYSVVST